MADDTIPPPAKRFKLTLLSMANIIASEVSLASSKGECGVNREIILFGIELIKASEDNEVIEGFIDRSYNYWDEVLSKNNDFFLDVKNSAMLFGELSSDIVKGFIKLIKEKKTSDNLLEALWRYLHVLVKISIAYIFLERDPQIVKIENGFNILYGRNNRPHINLEKEAAKWDVDFLKIK